MKKLYQGDFSDRPSQSEAILGLMNDLAFYTAKGTAQMESIYMSSSAIYPNSKDNNRKMAKNSLNRRFYTPYVLQKAVTDVTEFQCLEDEKLYLSPVMDLYNGEIIGFSLSKRSTLNFVLDSLNQALTIINNSAEYLTTIQSDQGWNY